MLTAVSQRNWQLSDRQLQGNNCILKAQEKRAKEEEELRKFAEKQAEEERQKSASKGINWRDLKVRLLVSKVFFYFFDVLISNSCSIIEKFLHQKQRK